ncbi:MAG: hypothetical protein ACFFC6_03630 [Promethearchaeota archaeon]
MVEWGFDGFDVVKWDLIQANVAVAAVSDPQIRQIPPFLFSINCRLAFNLGERIHFR